MAKKSKTAAKSRKSAKKASSSKRAGSKRPAAAARGKRGAASAQPALGRPKVTGEELLYMLFKEDYHARQIFDFLQVQTVKELEQYSPQQIVKQLSKPITDTVDRIRRKLAGKNRYLNGDMEFAVGCREQDED